MDIKKGSTVKVTYNYSTYTGVVGVVEQTPDGYSELYLIRVPNGDKVWLFPEEFELYTPPVSLFKEKIETKMAEYRECIPLNYVHHHDEAGYEETYVLKGLQLALDILNEEG